MRNYILKFLFFLPSLLIIAVLFLYFNWGYDQFMNFVLSFLNNPVQEKDIKKLITETKISFIGILFIGLIFCNLLLFYFRNSLWNLLTELYSHITISLKFRLKIIRDDKIYFILIIPFAFSVYLCITFPVTVDEAYNYLYFSSKGFFAVIGYYSNPYNNHILNTLSNYFMLFIPWVNDLILIRIPSIVFNLLTLFFAYNLAREYSSKKIALIFISLVAVLYYCLLYAFLARGYSLMNLCFILMSYAAIKIILQNKKIHWVYFSIAAIAGFYVMPSFLYQFLTINFLILLFKPKAIVSQLKSGVTILVSVFVLYLPIIIINGSDALFNNTIIKSIGRKEVINQLPGFIMKLLYNIAGMNEVIVLVFITLALFIFIRTKEFNQVLTLLSFFAIPCICFLIQSIIPVERTFIYLAFIMAYCFAVVADKFIFFKSANSTILKTCVALQILFLFNFYYFMNKNSGYFIYSIQFEKDYKSISHGQKFLIDDGDFYLYFLFNNAVQKKNYHYTYIPKNLLSVDTLTSKNDYVIIWNRLDKTVYKKPFIKNEDYTIYKF